MFATIADSTISTAADAVATVTPSLPWQLAIIPIITPLIIAGVKAVFPKIPHVLLPAAAPVLGVALDLAAHFTAGTALNPWLGLVLGAAGVALRETIDQAKKALALPPEVK